jgi:hypothetical protein
LATIHVMALNEANSIRTRRVPLKVVSYVGCKAITKLNVHRNNNQSSSIDL